MRGLINDFLIGCDPEFVLCGQGGIVARVDGYIGATGPVGHDHGGWVLECRPKPARGSYMLVKHLQTLLKGDSWREKVKWMTKARAGGWAPTKNPSRPYIPLGGHVHIDQNPYRMDSAGHAIEYSKDHYLRVSALDTVTSYLERLDILPRKESEERRNTTEYGKYGDVRVQTTRPEGRTHYHTEYRTMCSWLCDPKVAMLALTSAKLAAADPEGTVSALKTNSASFEGLKNWMDKYRSKDTNAYRVSERLLKGTLKDVQVDPDVDFLDRWEELSF